MADTLRPSQLAMSRRRTVTRLTPGALGRLRTVTSTKDGSEAPDSSRPVKLENSFRMKPQEEEKFQPRKAEQVIREVLEDRLKGVTYDPVTCQDLAKQLSTVIQRRVKDFRWLRYRVVCQVTLGQQTQQGLQVASRCVWDHSLDSYASVTYGNKSVFAVAQCYGIYFE